MPIGPPVSAIALVKVSVHGGSGGARVGEGGAERSVGTANAPGMDGVSVLQSVSASEFTDAASAIAVRASCEEGFRWEKHRTENSDASQWKAWKVRRKHNGVSQKAQWTVVQYE